MLKKLSIKLIFLIPITGCATLNPELAARAELTFRQHNKVASELLLLVTQLDVNSPDYQALITAEDDMLVSCQALNDLAIQHRDGKPVGPLRRLRVPKTIENCEDHTQRAQELLSRH